MISYDKYQWLYTIIYLSERIINMGAYKDLEKMLLMQSENQIFHASYDNELNFYRAVQSGDVEKVNELFTPFDTEGMGKLSRNPVHNIRYHFIVSVALITRFCIEGGLPAETAYTLSDLFIQKADISDSVDEIMSLHKEMCLEFTNFMHNKHRDKVMSMTVIRAIDFIHKNLRKPIKQSEIADDLGVNSSYLSSLFKKETGIGINAYIQEARIEAAKNMLQYSNYDFAIISEYLCFSSHSYFISVFKKHTGMTPKEYRSRYFQSNWNK